MYKSWGIDKEFNFSKYLRKNVMYVWFYVCMLEENIVIFCIVLMSGLLSDELRKWK